MALDNDEVYIASTGYIFLGETGTEAPTDLDSFDLINGSAEWESVGHTARDELPEFGYDGGDTENRGTWQNASLRVVETEAAADYVTFNVHQFNSTLLSLYYRTSGGTTTGRFEVVAGDSFNSERALLIVIVDGRNGRLGFHAPASDIRRNDSISLDTEEFAYLPLRANFLDSTDATYRMAWISPNLGPIAS